MHKRADAYVCGCNPNKNQGPSKDKSSIDPDNGYGPVGGCIDQENRQRTPSPEAETAKDVAVVAGAMATGPVGIAAAVGYFASDASDDPENWAIQRYHQHE